ncbi:peptidase C14, caspase domain-containing protein [Mucidula mucida]|nr:peptidase C14, caspase domain-containing protein [Mucidula mucida]
MSARRRLKLVIVAIAYRDCIGKQLPGIGEDIGTVLKYWLSKGFAEEDIIVLCDTPGQDAELIPTHDNILRVLKELAASFTDGGFYVLHYSGHGVQEEALVDSNELDNLDELGCDGFRADGGPIIEKCIIDDQMNEILVTAIQKCRGARLLTVFDCCNSGTILGEFKTVLGFVYVHD